MLKLNNKIQATFFSFLSFLIACGIYFTFQNYIVTKNQNADYINPAESLFGLSIPKDIHFCGEAVPQNDYSIKESLDKEIINPASALVLLKRCALWFPPIEEVLKRNNIPDDIKYIALEESNLTNSQSSMGAAGFWQFVPSTGTNYGLEIDEEVDERYSVEKSTEAACKFFKQAYARFGSWTIAAAAYNLGMGGIETQLKKQKNKKYYDLMLNKETAKYLYKVLALKTLVENSAKRKTGSKSFYGVPLKNFTVDSTISNLSTFAGSLGYSYNMLKVFNPWLRTNKLSNPSHKKYVIKFPKKEYLKNGLAFFEGDLVRENNDTLASQNNVIDTLALKIDTTRKITTRKDTDINEPR